MSMRGPVVLACAILVFIAAPLAKATDLSPSEQIPADEKVEAQVAADDFSAGRLDAAAAIYVTMTQDHPDCLYAWRNLGITRYQQGKLNEAHDALLNALALDSKDAFVRSALGITEYDLKQYNDARDNLEAAVILAPGDAHAHQFLGQTYDKLGLSQKAGIEFDKAQALEEKK